MARALPWASGVIVIGALAIACSRGALGATIGTPPAPQRATPERAVRAAPPSLIVVICIDQFAAFYLDRYGAQLTGGIARLMQAGAWYTNAHHDHAITETAPGHATLLSGRFPRSTGIMMNSIGVDDDAAPLIANGYGPGASPRRFTGTTLVDWLRSADRATRTLSVSMKDRAAILPNGRAASDVYWYSPDGRFVTSSYYRKSLPDWVVKFNDQQVAGSFAGKHWTLLLADSAYPEPDSVDVEGAGRDFMFPHLMPSDPFDANNLIRATPFIDDVTTAFALAGVRALELGAGSRTDLLAMSLSATDVIGHRYGPDSREIHDQVLRVDRVIGRFLDSLYAMRDSASVTVVLTADHGVGTIPELAARTITPAPLRVSLAEVVESAKRTMRAAQVDTNAVTIEQNLVLLDRAAFRGKKLTPDSLLAQIAREAAEHLGVLRVDRFAQVFADSARDEIARRWAHQFPSTVNIELLITLTRFSTWGGNVASHGSPYDYDSRVPVIFSGYGVTPGKHAGFVRTVDLAPTLAAIARVKPAEALDGVVLRNALSAVVP